MGFDRRDMLTPNDVAQMLRVPVSWVYKHTRVTCRDPLPHVKIGKYLRFFESDILGYLGATQPKQFNAIMPGESAPAHQQNTQAFRHSNDRTWIQR
jgi:hypothetical protein